MDDHAAMIARRVEKDRRVLIRRLDADRRARVAAAIRSLSDRVDRPDGPT